MTKNHLFVAIGGAPGTRSAVFCLKRSMAKRKVMFLKSIAVIRRVGYQGQS
jgi:hypothetical protein